MYGIQIEEGKKVKCPTCGSVYAIENDKEILYRNITLLYFDKETKKGEARCKQCKFMIPLDGSKELLIE